MRITEATIQMTLEELIKVAKNFACDMIETHYDITDDSFELQSVINEDDSLNDMYILQRYLER